MSRGKVRRPASAASGSSILPVVLIIGLILAVVGAFVVVVVGVAAYLLMRPAGPVSPPRTALPVASAPREASQRIPATTRSATKNKYVPRESEKVLIALLEKTRRERGDAAEGEITDQQIYEIMGTPTSRELPITVQRNGMTLTIYEARWITEEPGRSYQTVITFTNGRFAGGTIGAEFTKPKDGGGPAAFKPPMFDPPPMNTVMPKLSRGASDLIIDAWQANIPASYQPNRRAVRKLTISFNQNGTCSAEEFGADESSLVRNQGTWKLEKAEGHNLWLQVKIKINLTQEAIGWNENVLFEFRNDNEWESRGFLPNQKLTFRRLQ